MHTRIHTSRLIAVLCSLSIVPIARAPASAQEQAAPPPAPATAAAPAPQEQASPIPAEQLDSLVAPIALYPDPLLAQVLAASTYPLEVVQLQQWLDQHKDLKEQALTDAVQKQDWDPSVQSLAVLPDVTKLLASEIKWTTELGNAFLAQQSDVMDAVQRMRTKAKNNDTLKSTEQVKVETKTVEKETIVVIEQADPQVVYVPSYDPTVVYGAPVYPYPSIAYPPAGAYLATAAISFGVGIAVGAAFRGGGWGYNCGWGGHGHNNININNNNTFVRNSAARGGNQVTGARGGNQWQHNARHRGGAPYANQATANRFGGSTARETSREQRVGERGGGAGGQQPRAEARDTRQQSRGEGREARTADRGGGGQQPRAEAREARTTDRGGGDRVGDRSVSRSGGGGEARGDALGGSRGSYSGSSAQSSSARGSASMGSRGSGGGAGGGGGGGGARGGGGRGGGRR